MKVSDEMLRAACEAYYRRDLPVFNVDVLRAALEAALSDIPDPEEVRAEIMEGLAYGRSVETQRAFDAEAKLEKVRAWAPKHDEGLDALPYDTAPDYGELLDILDGKEQP